MFLLFLFQRYGIAVPILVVVTTLLAQVWVDHAYGAGYYNNHAWVTGVAFVTSGLAIGALVWFVAPPTADNPATYGLLRHVETLGRYTTDKANDETLQAKLKNFVLQPSGTDHFCYLPLNWCALVLLAVGTLFIAYDAFSSSSSSS